MNPIAPEQVIGNTLRTAMHLSALGIRLNRRSQAVGSAAVANLRDAGYTIVETRYLRILETGHDNLVAEVERLQDELARAGIAAGGDGRG